MATELLTPKECAAFRRCSVRKLDRERAEGRGCRYVRIDDRIFYRRSDVNRFIEAHVRGGDVGIVHEPRLVDLPDPALGQGLTPSPTPCRTQEGATSEPASRRRTLPRKSTNSAVVS
jgi:hypothetical protein